MYVISNDRREDSNFRDLVLDDDYLIVPRTSYV